MPLPGPTREAVFQALFAKLQNLAGIQSASRRFTMPSQIAIGDQPALMLWQQAEDTSYNAARAPNRVWEAWIIVAFTNTDPTIPGATIINPILDAIQNALLPDNPSTNTLTLGGIVVYCRIEGAIHVQTGDADTAGLGGAVIPIKIRLP